MTSLFFIMLLLFVLSLAIVRRSAQKMCEANDHLAHVRDSLKNTLDSVQVSNEQLNRILKIDEQFSPLLESGLFKYYPETRKFVAKDLIGKEIFDPNSVVIKQDFKDKTIAVGKQLESALRELSKSNDFKYLLVIEGNMANFYDRRKRIAGDDKTSYENSYKRALAVYSLWKENGIDLRKYGVEVLICGSGMNGKDRDPIEDNNKRFVIQIIPKIDKPVDNSN